MKAKRNIFDIVILTALLTSLIIRLFINNAPWISAINFVSLIVSVVSLFGEFFSLHNRHRLFPFFTGIIIILTVALTIIGVLLLLSVIPASDRFNDCIMLITLIIALPSKLYINISNKIFK